MESTPLITRPEKVTFFQNIFSRLRKCRKKFIWRSHKLSPRSITIGKLPEEEFPNNSTRNQKYSIITFLPLVLFQQFRFFLNMYFLCMALSQFIPDIRIGALYTYWGPLCFVIFVTLCKEAVDDFRRFRRDKEVNTQIYERLILGDTSNLGTTMEMVPAASLRVGDIVSLQKGQRVPADMILLKTLDSTGSVFIRTDQLDGETDWKLRLSVHCTQKLRANSQLLFMAASVFVEKPQKDINNFIGTFIMQDTHEIESLDIQNALWSGTVLATGHAIGLVIYTGKETRCVLNNEVPRSKIGYLDLQVNDLTKVLFGLVVFLSLMMISLKGFGGPWYRYLLRFVLLFSYIIPLSLRVNLDMGKIFYAYYIQKDRHIEGTVVRSSNITEELGRIRYLLADKTGTLTKNEMSFKKLMVENTEFNETNFHEVETQLTQHVTEEMHSTDQSVSAYSQIWESVLALALCHNVTPVYIDEKNTERMSSVEGSSVASDMLQSVVSESCGGAVPQQQLCDYQAASPDEVALVKWTDIMGISLYRRDLNNISVKVRATNEVMDFNILQVFPFTSESKMMGIIVQNKETNKITYYLKGADVVLCPLVGPPSWLRYQCDQLATEGLRTLVLVKKNLTLEEYVQFENSYREARCKITERASAVVAVLRELQEGMQLLALTGVEDKLAENVAETLALLKGAGMKLWMLTGDKLETALCIGHSLRLAGSERWHVAKHCAGRVEAYDELQQISMALSATSQQAALVIDAKTLDLCLEHYGGETESLLIRCGAVVVARCSPTQKASTVRLLRSSGKAVAAVGDGGNDVAMIQEADIGIGVEGLEGRAASLAGDVAIQKFSALSRLFLVHGRRSHMRTAALSLFVIHRGLVISAMQAIFSSVFYMSAVSLYQGLLMVGYATVFTMLPVFSLVLDRDIPGERALAEPKLYKDLAKCRALSYKKFYLWLAISVYQGGVIMYLALIMFGGEFIHIVAISYSALIFTELIMVALNIDTWHKLMFIAQVASITMYFLCLFLFHEYFDVDFIRSFEFIWKVAIITLVSCVPLYVLKVTQEKCLYGSRGRLLCKKTQSDKRFFVDA